jgi:hypothetical protein
LLVQGHARLADQTRYNSIELRGRGCGAHA